MSLGGSKSTTMRSFRVFFAAILGLVAVSVSAPTTPGKRVAHPVAVKETTTDPAVPDTVGCSFKSKRSGEAATVCDINN